MFNSEIRIHSYGVKNFFVLITIILFSISQTSVAEVTGIKSEKKYYLNLLKLTLMQ